MLKDLSYHLFLEIQCLTLFWKSQLVCSSEIKTYKFNNSSRPHLIQNSCLSGDFNKSISIPQFARRRLNSPHNLAFPQLSLEKKIVAFLKAVKIWSSQQRLFRWSEVWGLYVINWQIQLRHNSTDIQQATRKSLKPEACTSNVGKKHPVQETVTWVRDFSSSWLCGCHGFVSIHSLHSHL